MPDKSETCPNRATAERKRRSVLKTATLGVLPISKLPTDQLQVTQTATSELEVVVRQVNRPEFPEIETFATIRDTDGNPLSGLTASEMTVEEDDVEQTIESVTTPETDNGDGVSVSLVIDRSGSMDGRRISDAKQAARQFVEQLQTDRDEAQVIGFDTQVDIIQRWTRDKSSLNSGIDAITTDGKTAVWDATSEAVREAEPRVGRSAVIVLTDGRDNESNDGLTEAVSAATSSGIPVYTIGLGAGSSSPFNPDALQRLASETGGTFFEAPDSSDLAAIYNQITQSISGEYKLTYQTSNTATDGTRRTVRVSVADGGETGSDTGTYEAPCAPIPDAAFDITPSSPAAGTEIAFDASASSPNGGSITEYEWDFQNDGVTDATGQRVTHTYDTDGDYDARLTVQKGCGVTDVTVQTIDVGQSADDEERTLEIVPTGVECTYRVEVTGDIRPAEINNREPNPDDEIEDGTVTGQIFPDADGDAFRFTGDVVDITILDGDCQFLVDGEEVSPSTPDSRTLEVVPTGVECTYRVEVTGDIQPANINNREPNPDDEIEDGTVNGQVFPDADGDAFSFTGDVVDITILDGDCQFLVDGEEFEAEPSNGDSSRILEVVPTGVECDYRVEVTGDIGPAEINKREPNPDDEIMDRTVNGQVFPDSDGDAFRFTGEIANITILEGDCQFLVDGEEYTP